MSKRARTPGVHDRGGPAAAPRNAVLADVQTQTFRVCMECTGYRPQMYTIETNRINGEARVWMGVDEQGWVIFDDDDNDLWPILMEQFPPCWMELIKQLPEGRYTFKLDVRKWMDE